MIEHQVATVGNAKAALLQPSGFSIVDLKTFLKL
jgi:hypothetical protein